MHGDLIAYRPGILFGYKAMTPSSAGGGNDDLDGGAGRDILLGEEGNDIYYVDNARDVVWEYAGEGVDKVFSSVSYALSENVEALTLTGATALNGTGRRRQHDRGGLGTIPSSTAT